MKRITPESIDQAAFERDGFVKLRVLDRQENEHFLGIAQDLIRARDRQRQMARSGASEQALQHLGDQLEDYGSKPKNYYFHLINDRRARPLHDVFHHPNVLTTIEQLLGPELIINNGSMLAAEPGVTYNLGWHRDVIQIPEDQIRDKLFSPRWFHNNVQVNLALSTDRCLWVVPGSHNRPNTDAENIAFAGSKHYAPKDADMPHAIEVVLEPGEAVFYNNNLLHNGFCERIESPRRTIHLGYHTNTHKPSWHFYLLDPARIDDEFLDTVSPKLREMMIQYKQVREQYPDMSDTWQPGWATRTQTTGAN